MASFFSGTSGILLPYKNKAFYPSAWRDKSRLAVYGMLYNSLEVNSSFYKIPRSNTVERWCREVPDNFRFTFKLWRGITHNKNLDYSRADVAHFMHTINMAKEKKGCLLIQLPPSTGFSCIVPLQNLLEDIIKLNSCPGWHICVEFRHNTWYRPESMELLASHGASLVLHDKDGRGIPVDLASQEVVYLRFHGPNGDYRDRYEESFLKEYSVYIHDWLAENKTVYAYFNNTIGDALDNLNVLNRYVLEQVAASPKTR